MSGSVGGDRKQYRCSTHTVYWGQSVLVHTLISIMHGVVRQWTHHFLRSLKSPPIVKDTWGLLWLYQRENCPTNHTAAQAGGEKRHQGSQGNWVGSTGFIHCLGWYFAPLSRLVLGWFHFLQMPLTYTIYICNKYNKCVCKCLSRGSTVDTIFNML